MSKLMALFRDKVAKSKDTAGMGKEAVFDVMYPTGFISLDYLNGTMVHVCSDEVNMTYKSIGILDGSSNTVIGRSGCGKSTLVVQIMGNIARKNPNIDLYIDDIEGSLPEMRKQFLLGLSQEDISSRVHMRNTDITTENVYQQIKMIHDLKLENRTDFEYDTGLYDIHGNRIFKLVPTLYFIDSFAMLLPNDIATDEDMATNGTTATSTAKMNTQLIKKISQLLKGANIILFTVNHIMDDIQMGFLPKPVQVAGLRQGERLPGGKAAIYLANNMFRLDEKSTLKADEGYGVDGTVVDVTIVKSRTNTNKKSVPLIFNKTDGAFDNVLSMYHLLKSEGLVGGAGRSMYLNNAPDIKFSQKDFKKTLYSDPNLQKAFAEASKELLETFLSDTKNQDVVNDFDLNDTINNI